MKQVLQSLSTGTTEIAAVPSPVISPGELLISTSRSLISAGTERMLVEFGRANLIQKALSQPDRVRLVIDKAKTDGVLPTLDAVRQKLDIPLALGYCNAGKVIGIGAGVTGFALGDRVASNGKHAEVVSVPVNLCATIPVSVSDEDAAFTPLAAVALQGVRLAQPTLGEAVVVTGLGLIGLLTVQLLRAHGCRVMGIDRDPTRLAIAEQLGATVVDISKGEDPVASAVRFSRGAGVDAVLITASTSSSKPVHQAAGMCRQRGRIVLVGVTGLELAREDFYKKELTFQVSCSYGPGRHDPAYEQSGHDYPIGFVRWTEQRNFEAVLDMMEAKRLEIAPLVSHRFSIADAAKAFELIAGTEPSLGVVLEYPRDVDLATTLDQPAVVALGRSQARPILNVIGAGNYAGAMMLPAFKATGASLRTVISKNGVSAAIAARKFGFQRAGTVATDAISDPGADAVVIATRHDSHARLVVEALGCGKHVFVEKPLCLSLVELEQIEGAYRDASARGTQPLIMVGFNRRFAPHTKVVKSLLEGKPGPKTFVMTVNAGHIPSDHWVHDKTIGGGRLIGEGCHFVDLLRFLAGAPIRSHHTTRVPSAQGDTATVQLSFDDGSLGTLHYFANGSKRFPKERLEVFAQGRVLQLDNFRKLTAFGWPGASNQSLWRQDKGHRACAAAFVQSLKDGSPAPIPFDELVEVTRVTLEL